MEFGKALVLAEIRERIVLISGAPCATIDISKFSCFASLLFARPCVAQTLSPIAYV
jgi:hypothetical protein